MCKKWNLTAKKITVPLAAFRVDDEKLHHTMKTISSALPNLLCLLNYDYWKTNIDHRYADGEDPDEEGRGSKPKPSF